MNKLIVALDFPSERRALDLVRALQGQVGLFKVGLQLFIAAGPQVVAKIREEGGEVFLDLKFFDIPNTVSRAALEAARLRVRMLTFHALGGGRMLREARETLLQHSLTEGWPLPKLLGVTVLTSMDQAALTSVGVDRDLDAMVVGLARVVREAGLDGVVCSPRELSLLKRQGLDPLVFVTPGIRPGDASADDQVRTLTAAQAIAAGADYLVVGRPITQADNPERAASQLLAEIRRARMEHS
jgi:orotidine-5'-phosphate decarboxylase